jgi:hypothetical protein
MGSKESPAALIQVLAEIAKIIKRVLHQVCTQRIQLFQLFWAALTSQANTSPNGQDSVTLRDTELFLEELEAWRGALPNYLRFDGPEHSFESNASCAPTCWQARQRSSLLIRK